VKIKAMEAYDEPVPYNNLWFCKGREIKNDTIRAHTNPY
jgi:hypothetical protein